MNQPHALDSLDAPAETARRTGPSEVVAVRGAAQVTLAPPFGAAQIAAAGYAAPRVGDRVLAMRDDDGACWVVGVIAAPRGLLDEVLDADELAPTLVRDKAGRLLFEYHPGEDRAVVHVPEGDLEVAVARGAFRVSARDGLELSTPADARLSAGGVVELEAAAPPLTERAGGASSRVRLAPGEISIIGATLTAAAERAELVASRAGLSAARLETHVEHARHAVKVLETSAGRIVERARTAYREIEGLSQTRAGRLKLVAKRAASIVGESTLVKARDRVKIKGERIHLA